MTTPPNSTHSIIILDRQGDAIGIIPLGPSTVRTIMQMHLTGPDRFQELCSLIGEAAEGFFTTDLIHHKMMYPKWDIALKRQTAQPELLNCEYSDTEN